MRTKTQSTWHLHYIELETEQAEKTESTERQKDCFPKESVENTDLTKSVLNKIMATTKLCVKYNFVVPLGFLHLLE